MQKPGILPDIENNKPSIAYTDACFLPNNYTTYGDAARIDNVTRNEREVTFAAVTLSILVGASVASIIEFQMKTYNDEKLEDLESQFTLQLNQVEDQVTKLQAQ